MAKITTKIPKKTDPKPGPSRRISTDTSRTQLNKPKVQIELKKTEPEAWPTKTKPNRPPGENNRTKTIVLKPGHLRRNSIGLEKTHEPKPVPPRRYSTGNSSIQVSEPKPTPNYLRPSSGRGSCHDFCKYGLKYEVPMKAKPSTPPPLAPKRDQNVNIMQEQRSTNNYKGVKAIPRKQSNKTSLKKSSNRENSVQNPETEKTSYENVLESKIIHAIEPTEENEIHFPTPSSNEDNMVTITPTIEDIGLVIQDKRDYTYPTKLPFWRGKLLEMDMDMEKIKLRRVVCDRKFVHNDDVFTRDVLKRQEVKARNSPTGLMNAVIEETATELVQMRKSKMEALVGAFECVINLQDTESSRTINNTTL